MISLLVTVLIILVVCGAFALIFRYSPLPEPFKGMGVWVSLVGWRVHMRLP